VSGLTREAFLAHAGKLVEELVEVPEMGAVLCRELTGAQRAKVLEVLAPAAQEGGRADFGRYQQMLLQLGLVDPDSPADARQPLLDMAGAAKAMELGAGKVERLCSAIERLSGLDKRAAERAEGNSVATPSASATSA
jgi:hypothetical protein